MVFHVMRGAGVRPWLSALGVLFAAAAPPPILAQIPQQRPAWLAPGASYDRPFFEGAQYDPAIPAPEQILGYALGTRPASHAEVERCLNAWRASPRFALHEYARSHEQRALYYAVITSPENQKRLDAIRGQIGRLADPRRLQDEAELEQVIRDTPAVAWLAYAIHGDELSSTDAALAVAYHLVAGTDESVRKLLDDVIVIIDPLMNPDGRDRFIHQLDTSGSYVPNLDVQASQHRGHWPWGRGNHYLFDMNRDWVLGVHPETRGRQLAVCTWRPQLFVDSHEMGPDDTYLFNPPREPFNPNLSPLVRKWWEVFAGDQARAFDRFGWSYYTREWLEFWYPGYSDSWAAYLGAIGILYEQAGTGGHPIRQESGVILTYRESIHHQVVSTLANLETLRANRAAILRDFHDQARAAITNAPARTLVLVPGSNPTRERAFLANLHNQGVEIEVATQPFAARNVAGILRNTQTEREFPAGSYLIRRQQPLGALVGALLDFDPRMDEAFLQSERKELETKRRSRMYDVTAWSLPLAYALDAYWAEGSVAVPTRPYEDETPAVGIVDAGEKTYAYVIDGNDDASLRALALLLQGGVTVRVAEKGFQAAGRRFARGSLLIRAHENDPNVVERLHQTAEAAGARIFAAATARSPGEEPDLGGGHFLLLRPPRVLLFGGHPVAPWSFGEIWHLLDHEVGLAASLHDVAMQSVDLRPYNVIILPGSYDAEQAYRRWKGPLRSWVEAGGTLIAMEEAAAFLADEQVGLSAVRRRQEVLPKLDEYAYAVAVERAAGKTPVESAEVCDEPAETQPTSMPAPTTQPEAQLKTQDEWRSIFSPQGVILRGDLNVEHWLTFGCPAELPLFASGSAALLSKHPVETPVRFAEGKRLRLSGLLWPEAAVRLEGSAYATVERVGNGQVILFAQNPEFRGYWHGSRRLALNAILLGPGCGTSPPRPYAP